MELVEVLLGKMELLVLLGIMELLLLLLVLVADVLGLTESNASGTSFLGCS